VHCEEFMLKMKDYLHRRHVRVVGYRQFGSRHSPFVMVYVGIVQLRHLPVVV